MTLAKSSRSGETYSMIDSDAHPLSMDFLKSGDPVGRRAITRRDILRMAVASPVLALRPRPAVAGVSASSLSRESLAKAPGRIVRADGSPAGPGLDLQRTWQGPLCRSRVVNQTAEPVRVREVVLFDTPLALPPDTSVYGEGFQMLSQTGGTLGAPADLGNYTDSKHYRIPEPAGVRVVHGLLTLHPPGADHVLVAFTSCRRFDGLFRLGPASLEVVVDAEGLELGPGQAWDLEELTFGAGADREALLDGLAQRLAQNHPPLPLEAPPSGWCSWYCFGPRVTAQQVLDNLEVIATRVPGLRYIQIDDGYQPAMGDWLDTGPAFGGNVQGVLTAIRKRGFQPALWVAPFIAEAGSKLFQQHPAWFVKDAEGAALPSDRVTFGGWRRGPWYALDGTHPGAQAHLESVFRTMRREWGVTYFKLDANFWGAIHGGRFHDPRATRIEAYRRGMQAVLRGAGDAFVLGCNHPIWASLGLIHGSRSSNDIKRDWKRFATVARQNLGRNWQNGRLWWNDPDAVVLTGELGEEEFRFHATSIYASGGMILSGDDLTKTSPQRLEMLRKLQPPTGRAARFVDESLRVGVMDLPGQRAFCLLNWDDAPRTLSFSLGGPHRIRELWTGEDRGRHAGDVVAVDLPARSGRVWLCSPA
jgi:alpha-galactosidase